MCASPQRVFHWQRLIGKAAAAVAVHRYCFLPTQLAATSLQALLDSVTDHLQVFYQTVPIRAEVSNTTTDHAIAAESKSTSQSQTKRITAIEAVQRQPRSGVECGGYAERLSQVREWLHFVCFILEAGKYLLE